LKFGAKMREKMQKFSEEWENIQKLINNCKNYFTWKRNNSSQNTKRF
jgi:hypothetical protein